MKTEKVVRVTLLSIKSEEWKELASALKLTDAQEARHFEFGEYACLELVINKNLEIVDGRIVPVNEAAR